MKESRYKCSGNVELFYEGKWLGVCMDALQDSTIQNIICEELKCGQAVERIESISGAKSAGGPAISKIECLSNGNKTLSQCKMTVDKSNCILGGLRCSRMYNDFVTHITQIHFFSMKKA